MRTGGVVAVIVSLGIGVAGGAASSCHASSSTGSTAESGAGVDSGGGGIADGDGATGRASGGCPGLALPPDQHYVAPGLCASVVASGVSSLRQISFAPNGDIFGAGNDGTVYRMHDANGDGTFGGGEIAVFGHTGGAGSNATVEGGYVYAATADGVMRWPYADDAMSGGDGEAVIVGAKTGGHNLHTVHVYDGFVYAMTGSSGNMTDDMAPAYDTDRSVLKRFPLASFHSGAPLAWSSGELLVVGLRNLVGYTRVAPGFAGGAAGKMIGVVNGMDNVTLAGDDIHDDNPGEQVLDLSPGSRYGYPFCFTVGHVVQNGNVVQAGTQLANEQFSPGHDDAWCAANSQPPLTFIQAHSAPLDIAFFDTEPPGALPEKYRGGAFVALHGSWDRNPSTGYKVIWIPFDASGKPPMPTSTANGTSFPYEVVLGGGNASGAADGTWTWSAGGLTEAPRFTGVAVSPFDGALYASSDAGGFVYRIAIAR